MRTHAQPGESRHGAATPGLAELIPLAVVIAAGCETCAEKMVRAALERGSTASHVEQVLAIVAHLRSLDCFAQAIGTEAVERMARPLAAGRRTLSAMAPG